MTVQMKAIEQYFHVVMFSMLYKVVLTFTSVSVEELNLSASPVVYYRAILGSVWFWMFYV